MSRATIEPPLSRLEEVLDRVGTHAEALEDDRDARRVDLDLLGGDAPDGRAERDLLPDRLRVAAGRVGMHDRPVVDGGERVAGQRLARAARQQLTAEDLVQRVDGVRHRVGAELEGRDERDRVRAGLLDDDAPLDERLGDLPARERVAREPDGRLRARSTTQFDPLEPWTENIVRSAPCASAAKRSASSKTPVWSTSVPKKPAEIETSEA